MDKTSLGDRMKMYERKGQKILDWKLPIVVRLDGDSFSKFTKKQKFKKPFDDRMVSAMELATKRLMERWTDTVLAYTQSDEITLIIPPQESNENLFLNLRVDKLCSILASNCSNYFNESLHDQGIKAFAAFDCRAFNVPSIEEAKNALLWRQIDCWKNYVGIVAHVKLRGDLTGIKTETKIERLKTENNIDIYTDFDQKFHYGSSFVKEFKRLPLPEEWKKFKSNKGKEFIERKEIVQLTGRIDRQSSDIFMQLMIDGFIA
jgi:tRNA(His) guanylyltransferase